MRRAKPQPSILQAVDPANPALANPAVARCCEAWRKVSQSDLKDGCDGDVASYEARAAYREVLPSLSGKQNIRDFVACVAQGMLLGAIEGSRGGKLLYAAQVALCYENRSSPNLNPPADPLPDPPPPIN